MMAYTFTQIIDRLNTKLLSVLKSEPKFPNSPLFFGSDVASKTMCYPALTSFSTLEESPETTASKVANNSVGTFSPSFAPYICSARTKLCKYNHAKYKNKRNKLNYGYYRGWSFIQDRPGCSNMIFYMFFETKFPRKFYRQAFRLDNFIRRS